MRANPSRMRAPKVFGVILLFTLWGCSPPEPGESPTPPLTPGTTTTVPMTPTATPTEVAMAATPFPEPDVPVDRFRSLHELSVFKPEMRESETWWANSGITENRLGYYTSERSVADLEKELLSVYQTPDNKPFLEGIPAVFSFEDNRVCLMRRGDTDLAQMFILAPLNKDGQLPAAVRELKLPPIPPAELKGKKTLVVLATGYGLGEHVDHMLANAGLVITPTP